jgi:DNA repair protein RecN (Recombination protein N)
MLFSAGAGYFMIKLLRIKNIALVDSVEVELEPGLTLLTGETGAGKSILIDALGLLLGARASSEIVRAGEETGVVEAVVESAALAETLGAHALPADGDEVVVRREVQASGRGKATVNGALVPVSLLRELAPLVAAIHGQHEPQGLLDPQTHVDMLDAHGGLTGAAREVASRFARLKEAESALESFARDRREAERRRDALEFQAGEIEEAHLGEGEEEELRRERARLANAERLAAAAAESYALLYEDEAAVLGRIGQVYRKVEELAAIDAAFAPYVEARAAIKAQLEDLALQLRDYQEGLQVSPARLDTVESRLSLIERLKRKYGSSLAEVIAFGRRCREELDALADPEGRERALVRLRDDAVALYRDAALALSKRRRQAARDLERRVEAELGQLAMEKTRFRVGFEPEEPDPAARDTWSERGLEQAEFLLAPNPGEPLRPLARIASGGELSRIMLALKSVAHVDARGKTLVFDEVDAGIGGRVAEVVGRKLRGMAAAHQVLCVTHLPQIASLADHHLVVHKRAERGRTRTTVERVEGASRIEEVARMLGGETITEAARRHARELVALGTRS